MAPPRALQAWILVVVTFDLVLVGAAEKPRRSSLRYNSSASETVVLDELGDAKCARAYVEDCGGNGRCCDSGMKCFEKHIHWAACMPSCTPGIQPWVDWLWHWTPWTCMPLVVAFDDPGVLLKPHQEKEPLLPPSTFPHQYDVFRNKVTPVGIPIFDDSASMQLTFVESADSCKKLCDKDRRCDCFVYSGETSHCEKRRACSATLGDLEDHVGSNFYVKLPLGRGEGEEAEASQWSEYKHKNIFFSDGLRLDDEDSGSSTLASCQRRCELSRYCQCLTYFSDSGQCERYTECKPSTLIADDLYDVYIREEPKLEEPQDSPWWSWLLFVLLVLACCLCIFLWAKREPAKAARPLPPIKPRLDVTLKDAATLERWPGSCAHCGCACGRPPAWVPRSGAAVVTEDRGADWDRGDSFMPGDIMLSIGKRTIKCTDDVEEALSACKVDYPVEMVVLRPRVFGEYSCSRDLDAEDVPLSQVSMAKPGLVVQAAMPTHKKVTLLRKVG